MTPLACSHSPPRARSPIHLTNSASSTSSGCVWTKSPTVPKGQYSSRRVVAGSAAVFEPSTSLMSVLLAVENVSKGPLVDMLDVRLRART